MTRVHGKSSNRLYRLDTGQGSFAVKELNLADRRWTYHADEAFRAVDQGKPGLMHAVLNYDRSAAGDL